MTGAAGYIAGNANLYGKSGKVTAWVVRIACVATLASHAFDAEESTPANKTLTEDIAHGVTRFAIDAGAATAVGAKSNQNLSASLEINDHLPLFRGYRLY